MDQKTNKYILIILGSILIIMIFMTFISYNSLKKEYKNTINAQAQIINDQRTLNNNQFSRYKKSLMYSDIKLKNTALIDSLKINKSSLFLRFPKLECNTCMDSLISYVVDNFHEKEFQNIYLLINNSHKMYMSQFKRLHGLTFPNIIAVDHLTKLSKLDNHKLPYMFIIDKSNTTRLLFIPEKDKPKETKAYIKLIKSKYFDN
jgi:peroxiredoxin family protein